MRRCQSLGSLGQMGLLVTFALSSLASPRSINTAASMKNCSPQARHAMAAGGVGGGQWAVLPCSVLFAQHIFCCCCQVSIENYLNEKKKELPRYTTMGFRREGGRIAAVTGEFSLLLPSSKVRKRFTLLD
eukprot:SAG11_NODE_3790_length_2224_cov_1.824000_1_plen_129_part_10